MSDIFDPNLVIEAYERLKGVVYETPLQFNKGLSEMYGAGIYLKREDLQAVRSYKLRGAFNRMSLLTDEERKRGVVCASAGNHAQGFAFGCEKLQVKGTVFMPKNTPRQKIDRIKFLGKDWVTLELVGDTFDEAYAESVKFADKENIVFVHPFNDPQVIAGQGTVAVEIFNQLKKPIDYFVVPIGGGGFVSGLGSYVKQQSPKSQIVGVEPAGAPAMYESLKAGKVVTLEKIDKFVDGAAVKSVGSLTFEIAKKVIDKMLLVDEGQVCTTMINLYQKDGIIAEPAGALSVAVLDQIKDEIRGKTVVCIISGGNNDISRYPEVIERSLVYKGLKHYFIIEFSQRPGSLRRYLDEALGQGDDITLFEYVKKNNRETGPALVGVELSKKEDLKPLLDRMDGIGLTYELLKADSPIFSFII